MDGGDGGWMDGWIHRMGSTLTVECDTAVKRSEALAQDTTWTDFAHPTLRGRGRGRRAHCLSLLALPQQNRGLGASAAQMPFLQLRPEV